MIAFSLITGFGMGGEAPTTNEMCKSVVNQDHVTTVLPLANNLGGVGEVLALITIAATSSLPNKQAWRAQLGFGASLALINFAARTALKTDTRPETMAPLPGEDPFTLSDIEKGCQSEPAPFVNENTALLTTQRPSALTTKEHHPQHTEHEKLLNSRWTPLVASSASVCFLHEMVINAITAYSPEFLDERSLFSVYVLACAANFATPYTLAAPSPDSKVLRLTALGRHGALVNGLLLNASIYLGIALTKNSLWHEAGDGQDRTIEFSDSLSKCAFTTFFVMQQVVFAAYTAAPLYAFPSETIPQHQTGEAVGKVAAMGKVGAIFGTLLMPLIR
jgi:hypothetical protein